MTHHNTKKSGDVLSSLKRIVSDGDVYDTPAVQVEPEPKPTKLVLTQSLRVHTVPKPAQQAPLVLSNSLETKITHLEEIISRIDGPWEPDGIDARDDYSGQETASLQWDRVADAPRDEFDIEMIPTPQQAPTIDPDALQQMVAKIVRDELKGTLGEKITTNIRKMVRREILSAIKDLDIK